jgi:hypothetical protein
VRATTFS